MFGLCGSKCFIFVLDELVQSLNYEIWIISFTSMVFAIMLLCFYITIFLQAWAMEAKWLFCTLGCITSSYWLGLFYTCFHRPGLSFRGWAVTTAGTQVPNIHSGSLTRLVFSLFILTSFIFFMEDACFEYGHNKTSPLYRNPTSSVVEFWE